MSSYVLLHTSTMFTIICNIYVCVIKLPKTLRTNCESKKMGWNDNPAGRTIFALYKGNAGSISGIPYNT